jgi:hypothetical protein
MLALKQLVTAKTVTTRQPRVEVTAENAKSLPPALGVHSLAGQE